MAIVIKNSFVFLIFASTIAYYLSLSQISCEGSEGKIIETKSGPIQGIVSMSRDGREFYEWLGIPYAKPPVGKLRFASPEPVDKWTDVRDGGHYGSHCIQNVYLVKSFVVGDEDCLFLNIHTPKILLDEKKPVPVMVYIHGGAFLLGGPHIYRPEFFMDEDIVIVTIHYRLDIFGFLSTGDKAIRGNMGLKDQTLALKWIQKNINSFGGDPNKVTIFGHSAGGASVHYLLLSSMTKGLFHKAISISGAASSPWGLKSPEKSIKKTKIIAEAMNCPINDTMKLAECLRGASSSDLMATVWDDLNNAPLLKPHKFGDPTVPTIELVDDEEAFLTQHPLEIIIQGKAHRVPWLVGHTSDEGMLSAAQLKGNEDALTRFEENFEECLKSIFVIDPSSNFTASEKAISIRDFYLPPTTPENSTLTLTGKEKMEIYTKILGDALFNFDIHESILYQRHFSSVYPFVYSKTNGPSITDFLNIINSGRYTTIIELVAYTIKTIVAQSVFGMEPPENDEGANHGADVVMLFDWKPVVQVPKRSKHYEFSKSYVKLLVDFASAEDESTLTFRGAELPAASKNDSLQFFDITNDIPRIISEPFGERMHFLHALKIRDYKSKS